MNIITKWWVSNAQKQPSRGILTKRCSENMQQFCRRTPMPKCDFNKVASQLYWNRTSVWVFSCKFAAYWNENTLRHENKPASLQKSIQWLWVIGMLIIRQNLSKSEYVDLLGVLRCSGLSHLFWKKQLIQRG